MTEVAAGHMFTCQPLVICIPHLVGHRFLCSTRSSLWLVHSSGLQVHAENVLIKLVFLKNSPIWGNCLWNSLKSGIFSANGCTTTRQCWENLTYIITNFSDSSSWISQAALAELNTYKLLGLYKYCLNCAHFPAAPLPFVQCLCESRQSRITTAGRSNTSVQKMFFAEVLYFVRQKFSLSHA